MKVYAVKHEHDNGLSYEDYREYEDIELFSTYEKANHVFWDYVTSDYEGQYILSEWELDTQDRTTLDKSVYIPCTSEFDKANELDWLALNQDDRIYEYPEEDVQYPYYEDEEDIYEEEWLTHKGENYEIFSEIESDRLLKLNQELDQLLINQ